MLNINNIIESDNSVTGMEMHTYSPYNLSFKNSDEIRISIQHQELFLMPSESFIYIEGTFLNAAGDAAATTSFTNNCVAFLFDEIRYELNGVEIDKCKNPGITSTMKGYVSFTESESSKLIHSGWSHNTAPTLTAGAFNFCVPLKHLLGFAEDFQKIIINSKHELILIRARSDDNSYITTANDIMTLHIDKLQWRMPHVTVADSEKIKILKTIQSNRALQVGFRNWEIYEYPILPVANKQVWTVKTVSQLEKPRYVIVGLQTNRKNQKDKNSTIFDHCNISNFKLHLNSECYPYDNLNLNFTKNQFSILYEMYSKFQQSYYNRQSLPLFSYANFKTIAPLVVIDCSRQNESIKSAPIDISLEFELLDNIPANTSAYCIIIHDRIIEYNPLTNIVRRL